MSAVTTIARKDFKDSLRSRSLWVITGLMTLLIAAAWLTFTASPISQQADRPFTLAIAQFTLWIPLAAIGLGFKSVVGERTSGSVRVLLGQPGTRRDVVFGTYLGRLTIFVVAILISLSVLSGLVFADYDNVTVTAVTGGTIALLLYALAWIGMTVGVSSLVASESKAIGIMVGLYALVEPLWQNLILRLFSFAFTGTLQIPTQAVPFRSLDGPTWYLYANRLSPSDAFDGARNYIPDVLAGLAHGEVIHGPHAPNVFGLIVLLAWAIVPVYLGYLRFKRAELQ